MPVWNAFKTTCLLFTLALITAGYCLADMVYPSAPDKATLINTGQKSALVACPNLQKLNYKGVTGSLNSQFTLVNWNIYKQQNDGWQSQLQTFLNKADLLTLQEVKYSSKFNSLLKQNNFSNLQNVAFYYHGQAYGVSNLSHTQAQQVCGTSYKEPWIRVAKSVLASSYKVQGSKQPLLLINVHGINFTFTATPLQEQLNPYIKLIKQHQGPVIISGDFNTWSSAKMAMLNEQLNKLGLNAVSLSEDYRKTAFSKPLDHIFYRDLNMISATTVQTEASDHAAMIVTFSI